MGITKLVDFLRDLLDKEDTWPRFTWIVAAFVIALAICLGFEVNIIGGFFKELPAFSGSSSMDGTAGQILTAIGLAGAASYWHERMDLASSSAKVNDVVVEEVAPTTYERTRTTK
jgi:membrane-bound ClpP family serine protease